MGLFFIQWEWGWIAVEPSWFRWHLLILTCSMVTVNGFIYTCEATPLWGSVYQGYRPPRNEGLGHTSTEVDHHQCAEAITKYEGNSERITEEGYFKYRLWSQDKLHQNHLFWVSCQVERPMDKMTPNRWGRKIYVTQEVTYGSHQILRVPAEGSVFQQRFQLLCSEIHYHYHTMSDLANCCSSQSWNSVESKKIGHSWRSELLWWAFLIQSFLLTIDFARPLDLPSSTQPFLLLKSQINILVWGFIKTLLTPF